jgi:hypothetical protein
MAQKKADIEAAAATSSTNNNGYSTLTPNQQKGVEALLSARDTRSASKATGIAERTFYRWKNDPAFCLALKAAETDALGNVTRRLATAANSALDLLLLVLGDKTAPQSVRVNAARIVLENTLKMREMLSLEERIAALEGLAGDK